MSRFGPRRLGLGAGAVGLVTALLVVPSGAHATPPIPTLRLVSGLHHLELDRFGKNPHLFVSDPAYVEAVNGAFEIDAVRANGKVTLRQVVRSGSKVALIRTIKAPVPVRMPMGLPEFFTMRLTDATGRTVATSQVPFCPSGGYDSQRIDPDNSLLTPIYPQQCGDKLTHATIWGIDAGWADGLFTDLKVDPTTAPDGKYTLIISVTRSYAQQLTIPVADRSISQTVDLVTQTDGGCADICPVAGPNGHYRTAAIRRAVIRASRTSSVGIAYPRPGGTSYSTTIGSPGLPDLSALPAHDLAIRHSAKTGQDWLGFGATIWNAGPGTFDIEGFRHDGRPTMQARQYVGKPNGSSTNFTIGTFEFDNREGHHHWHLEDVARYTLLDQQGNRVVRSHKQSFCLAPTDPINLLRPGAQWNPYSIGLFSSCPTDQSLWLRETLPVGWGDTYVQQAGGQAFNITTLPNGTYLIRVTTNPRGVIHEVTRSNDSSYLKITLGGTPGARTVTTVGALSAP